MGRPQPDLRLTAICQSKSTHLLIAFNRLLISNGKFGGNFKFKKEIKDFFFFNKEN